MVRENIIDDIYEAGKVYDISKKITFDASDDHTLYQLGWKTTSIIGQVEQVLVKQTRTLFILLPLSENGTEK